MTIALTDTATLHPLVLPARADAADAVDLHDYADIRNASLRETTGRDDEHIAANQLLPLLRSDADVDRRQWLIRDGQDAVGIALLNVLADDGGSTAFFSVNVLRRAWSRGIGSAALAQIERTAADAGVRKLQLWVEHQDAGEERLPAPTGFGSVPLDHSARFLQRHGFTLGQVDRVSTLDLAANLELLCRLRDDAVAASVGYRILQWSLPTPAEHRDGYAHMKHHMSTDAPDADLETPEEIWDAERVVRHDARWAQRGSTVLVTAAQHVATGELCAYNELSIDPHAHSTTHQEDTFVLSGHRGHRLGMLVKTAGMLAWREQHPSSDTVITFNAEENRPMLSINEALGFTPVAYEGAWRKDLR